jgi:hypothetical protein
MDDFELPQPKSGERWIELGVGEGWWRVTTVKNGKVGLTGPGPCRSYQEILLEDFIREWEPFNL